jgi:uncharacterized cupredoxin-like copper-binding protein
LVTFGPVERGPLTVHSWDIARLRASRELAMNMTRRPAVILATAALLALLAMGCSSSDSGSATTTSGGVTVTTAAEGTTVNVDMGDTEGLKGAMTLTASAASAPAGNVTFVVKNSGTIDHEMIVLKTDTPFDQLPVVDAGDPPAPVTSGADKVDEAGNVGETGEPDVKPGTTRTFTIKDMAAGKYVLVCNIAKHYGMGMRAAFTVR